MTSARMPLLNKSGVEFSTKRQWKLVSGWHSLILLTRWLSVAKYSYLNICIQWKTVYMVTNGSWKFGHINELGSSFIIGLNWMTLYVTIELNNCSLMSIGNADIPLTNRVRGTYCKSRTELAQARSALAINPRRNKTRNLQYGPRKRG